MPSLKVVGLVDQPHLEAGGKNAFFSVYYSVCTSQIPLHIRGPPRKLPEQSGYVRVTFLLSIIFWFQKVKVFIDAYEISYSERHFSWSPSVSGRRCGVWFLARFTYAFEIVMSFTEWPRLVSHSWTRVIFLPQPPKCLGLKLSAIASPSFVSGCQFTW